MTDHDLDELAESYALQVFDERQSLVDCVAEFNGCYGASADTVALVKRIKAVLDRWGFGKKR